MKNRIFSLLAAAAVFICAAASYAGIEAAAEGQYIYDYADILSSSEEEALADEAGRLREKLEMDIIILTSNDMDGKSWEEYADDFYDERAFGYEQEHGTGIIFLISMDSDNRGITITTSGHAIEKFTDSEIEWMYDDIIEYMYDADYYGGCKCFLKLTDKYAGNTEVAENGYYDEQKNDWVEASVPASVKLKRVFTLKGIAVRFLISMAVSAVVVLLLCHRSKTKVTVRNSTYLKNQLNYSVKNDRHVNTTTRVRRLNNDSHSGGGSSGHSSTHTSSGGFSHGGGGGRGF